MGAANKIYDVDVSIVLRVVDTWGMLCVYCSHIALPISLKMFALVDFIQLKLV